MLEPMRVWVESWMSTLNPQKIERKGDRYFVELVELMGNCYDQYQENGTIEDDDLLDLEFKLAVFNREKWAQEEE